MPQVVAGIATWYAGLSAGAALVVNIAVSAVLSVVSSKLFGPKIPRVQESLRSQQVMTRSALEFRKVVYGEAMVSGPIVYNNLSGDNNEYLWYVIALSEGQNDDLVSIWFDGYEIPKADIDWHPSTLGSGAVSTSRWVSGSTHAVRAFWKNGGPNQTHIAQLDNNFTEWTPNHRLRGVAYIAVALLYNEATETIWKEGQPNDIKAVVRGQRLYDPRLDSTNGGSGSHRFSSESTWEWSDNPALVIANYLSQFMGVGFGSIDWTSIADAADDCDVSVAIPTASTEKRFTCNGVLSLGESHKTNLEKIASSCDGKLSYSTGMWKFRASVWESPDLTITADDLAGDIEVRGSAPKSERFNTVRGDFIDPEREYQPVEFPQISSLEYLARDNNQPILNSLELPMTNSITMAQRIAFRILEQGNNQIQVILPLNKVGAKVAIGDTINVDLPTMGWTEGGNLLAESENFSEWSGYATSSQTDQHFPAPHFPGPHFPDDHFPEEGAGAGNFTASDALSPSGTTRATRVEADSGGTAEFYFDAANTGDATGNIFAIYAKPGAGANGFRLRNQTTDTELVQITVNFATGAITYNGTPLGYAQVEEVYGGWKRIILAATSGVIDDDDLRVYAGFDGSSVTAGEFVYLWGAQLVSGRQIPAYYRTSGQPVALSPKTFRVFEWSRTPDGAFRVACREEEEGDYTDPIEAEYASEATGGVAVPSNVVPPPRNLTATAVPNGVLLDWDDPPSRLYDHIEVWISYDPNATNRELLATVPQSPFTDNVSKLQRKRYYWVRAVNFLDDVSAYEPNTSTSNRSAWPEIQTPPIVKDPYIRQGPSVYEFPAGPQTTFYIEDQGLVAGTDVIRFRPSFNGGGQGIFRYAARRGPYEWDAELLGIEALQIHFRHRLYVASNLATWDRTLYPVVWFEDEDGSNVYSNAFVNEAAKAGAQYTNTSTAGIWKDSVLVAKLQDNTADTPRFIRIGFQITNMTTADRPQFDLDLVNVQIATNVFDGADTYGLVPNPVTSSGRYLKDDGTWDTPA